MAVIDYVIIAVILISALVSFARGFLREALSLVAWSLAIVSAFHFAPNAAPFFSKWLSDPTLQYWSAVVALFLLTLFCCGIINWLVGQFFSEFGTSGTDRSLGILLGAARGAVVVALMLLGGKVISLPLDEWGAEAKIYPRFSNFSEWLWQKGSTFADDWTDQIGPADNKTTPATAPAATPAPAEPSTGTGSIDGNAAKSLNAETTKAA